MSKVEAWPENEIPKKITPEVKTPVVEVAKPAPAVKKTVEAMPPVRPVEPGRAVLDRRTMFENVWREIQSDGLVGEPADIPAETPVGDPTDPVEEAQVDLARVFASTPDKLTALEFKRRREGALSLLEQKNYQRLRDLSRIEYNRRVFERMSSEEGTPFFIRLLARPESTRSLVKDYLDSVSRSEKSTAVDGENSQEQEFARRLEEILEFFKFLDRDTQEGILYLLRELHLPEDSAHGNILKRRLGSKAFDTLKDSQGSFLSLDTLEHSWHLFESGEFDWEDLLKFMAGGDWLRYNPASNGEASLESGLGDFEQRAPIDLRRRIATYLVENNQWSLLFKYFNSFSPRDHEYILQEFFNRANKYKSLTEVPEELKAGMAVLEDMAIKDQLDLDLVDKLTRLKEKLK